jgi:hypothetical protein
MQTPGSCWPGGGRGEYCVDWQTHVPLPPLLPMHVMPESDEQAASVVQGTPSA